MNPLSVDQAMQIAIGHHQVGRRAEAETIYPREGRGVPLHLLGVLAGEAGDSARAIDLITRAIAVDPTVPEHHNNLGEFYRQAGRLPEAAASLRRAIELKPDLAVAHSNLGNVLKAQGLAEQ